MIVKHNNPCGVAIGADAREAYRKALACDPVSAFGGVVALNRAVDAQLAEALHEGFVEVLIAPSFSEGALRILRQKEAIRIMENGGRDVYEEPQRDVRRVRGGLLVQDADRYAEQRERMRS